MQKSVNIQRKVVQKSVSLRRKVVQKNVNTMERIGYNLLIQWKNSKNRKPLIVNGARQVGKTWLLNEFAKREYKKKVMFSLDRHEKVREVFANGGSVE